MKKMFILMIGVFLISCTDNAPSTLSCSNSMVLDLAMNNIRAASREPLFKIYLRNEGGGFFPKIWVDMSYEELKEQVSNSEEGKRALAKTDSTIKSFKLSDMRLKNKNQTNGIISCAANLSDNDNMNASIGYTAQTTDEGNIYVEVSGL